ncbi:MAG: FecR domain-containing protein [Fidelibacterota bacterium]
MAFRKRILGYFIIILLATPLQSSSKVAVTTKVSGKANIEAAGKSGFSRLKTGTILSDGDRIKTGEDGFVIFIYIDDKSMIKVKEKTEVMVMGERTVGSISKQVNVDSGTLRAQVSKQNNSDFIVQSPTSVASVKGTDFWMITDPNAGDMLIGLEGLVNLTNLLSGESMDVGSGMTGISALDGSVETSETNPDNIPDDPDVETPTGSQIEIELEGPNGEIKTLLIDIQ